MFLGLSSREFYNGTLVFRRHPLHAFKNAFLLFRWLHLKMLPRPPPSGSGSRFWL